MSLIDSFDLADYETREELEGLLDTIEYEQSTLRGFERGAREKIVALDETDDPNLDEDPSADELYRSMEYGEVKGGCQFHQDARNQHCPDCNASKRL